MAKKRISDSHLELNPSEVGTELMANGEHSRQSGKSIPVVDLDSRTPLPRLEHVSLPALNTSSGPKQPPTGETSSRAGGPGSLWLNGNVVMCACPDCGAPMTVRLWLMMADCWRCDTSIELSEEQEREARRLLRERGIPTESQSSTSNRPETAPVSRRDTAAPNVAATTKRLSPAYERPGQSRRDPPTAPSSRPAPPSPRASTDSRIQRHDRDLVSWLHSLLQDMPAWMISLLFHIILLTFLGLLTQSDDEGPYIRLSAKIARDVREGGDTRIVTSDEESEFDLGVPDDVDLDNPTEQRALARADQEARELRLVDPSNPNLPDLEDVKRTIGGVFSPSKLLAARDPRLRVEMVKREGGTTLTEAAVARGLLWLARHQNRDGSWSLDRFHQAGSCRCSGRGTLRSNHAGTALALLPFLGAGQTHLTGIYRDEVSRGIRWLIEHQKSNGDLRGSSDQYPGMYAHGQAAIVLCEAFLMTGDEELRVPAQRAIDFIVAAQYLDGGWRYFPKRRGMLVKGDTSVLGWQLMALQSGLAANLNVPSATLENAGHFLDGVQHYDGARYGYIRNDHASPPMTAEGLLCRIYLGWNRNHPALRDGIDWMVDELPPSPRLPNIYYWYYATQTIHHFGGSRWKEWNLDMRDVLVGTQETRGHAAGSWKPAGELTRKGGRLYMTALAICCLEVYYRHLPLFRQIDLE